MANQVLVFVPSTGPDLLSRATQIMYANLKRGEDAVLELPSLRQRAKLVVDQRTFIAMMDSE